MADRGQVDEESIMNETPEYKGVINNALGLEHGPHTQGWLFLARPKGVVYEYWADARCSIPVVSMARAVVKELRDWPLDWDAVTVAPVFGRDCVVVAVTVDGWKPKLSGCPVDEVVYRRKTYTISTDVHARSLNPQIAELAGMTMVARLADGMAAQGVVGKKPDPDRIPIEAMRLVKTIPGGKLQPGQG